MSTNQAVSKLQYILYSQYTLQYIVGIIVLLQPPLIVAENRVFYCFLMLHSVMFTDVSQEGKWRKRKSSINMYNPTVTAVVGHFLCTFCEVSSKTLLEVPASRSLIIHPQLYSCFIYFPCKALKHTSSSHWKDSLLFFIIYDRK